MRKQMVRIFAGTVFAFALTAWCPGAEKKNNRFEGTVTVQIETNEKKKVLGATLTTEEGPLMLVLDSKGKKLIKSAQKAEGASFTVEGTLLVKKVKASREAKPEEKKMIKVTRYKVVKAEEVKEPEEEEK